MTILIDKDVLNGISAPFDVDRQMTVYASGLAGAAGSFTASTGGDIAAARNACTRAATASFSAGLSGPRLEPPDAAAL